MTDATSRFGKKSNIKEMLVRNFFRKYPIPLDMADLDQLQIERTVGMQMEEFVMASENVNSKALKEFEVKLAKLVGLKRQPHESVLSPLAAPKPQSNNFVLPGGPSNKRSLSKQQF